MEPKAIRLRQGHGAERSGTSVPAPILPHAPECHPQTSPAQSSPSHPDARKWEMRCSYFPRHHTTLQPVCWCWGETTGPRAATPGSQQPGQEQLEEHPKLGSRAGVSQVAGDRDLSHVGDVSFPAKPLISQQHFQSSSSHLHPVLSCTPAPSDKTPLSATVFTP